jgi:DGQHR domain-containing protein
MSFADVASSFRLSEDYPRYRTQNWQLQELYQRSLDRERVHEIATRYLQSGSGRPAFFNSITVALSAGQDVPPLPTSVVDFQQAVTFSLPGIALAVQRTERFGEIHVPASAAFGRASWITSDEMLAVAIDGQHRLAAIQKFAEQNRQQAATSFVSVIVVLFDPKVGFRSDAIAAPVEAMRSVFIDLNKHAVPVSTARNLLLDDASAHAACLRSLMSAQLALSDEARSLGSNKVGSWSRKNGEFDRSIPLALVDWHGENKSKIDEGPYITSVLALNWWTSRILKANKTKRYQWKLPGRFDPDAVHPYKAYLELAKRVDLPNTTVSRITACESAVPKRAFHFTDDEIRSIGDAFGTRWGGAVVTLLCTLEPYREVVLKRESANSIEPMFSQWYQCYDEYKPFAQSQTSIAVEFGTRLQSTVKELARQGVNADDFKKLVDEIEAIKQKSLFFLLVAQRALLIAFIEMLGDIERIEEMSRLLGDNRAEAMKDPMCVVARYLVQALNAIYTAKPEVFTRDARVAKRGASEVSNYSERLWAGSVLNPQASQVDFSEAAATRTALWLQLMVHLYWIEKGSGKGTASKFVDAHLDGVPPPTGIVEGMCSASLAALLPAVRSVRSIPKFYDSPANFLAQMPERITDAWRSRRKALAKERLQVISNAVRAAVV